MNLYAYVDSNPVNYIDPYGLWGFPYHGYYGGPGWTANRDASWEDLTDQEKADAFDPASDIYPRDKQDICYRDHDKCYGDCRERCESDPCPEQCKKEGFNDCDEGLYQCLINIGVSESVAGEIRRRLAIPVFGGIQPGYRNRGYSTDGNYYQIRIPFSL